MCGDMVGEDGRAGERWDTVVVAVVGTSRRGGKPPLARVTTSSRERRREIERERDREVYI